MTASHSYSMHHRHWLTVNGIEKRAIHLKQFSVDIGTEEKPMKNTPVARNPFHSSMIVTRTNKHFFIYFIINVYIYSYTYITHNIQRRIFPVRCLSISYNVNRQRQWLSLFQAFFFPNAVFPWYFSFLSVWYIVFTTSSPIMLNRVFIKFQHDFSTENAKVTFCMQRCHYIIIFISVQVRNGKKPLKLRKCEFIITLVKFEIVFILIYGYLYISLKRKKYKN